MNFHQLEVRVRDRTTREGLSDQDVRAHLVWKQEETALTYDRHAQAFVADGLIPGLYVLRLTKTLGETTEHRVQVDPAPTKITLWTGPLPLPADISDGAQGDAYLLGVLPHPIVARRAGALSRLTQSALSLGLEPIRGWATGVGKESDRQRLAVFSLRSPAGLGKETLPVLASKVVATLLADETVAAAGLFVGEPAAAGVMWTQQIYLHLAPGTSLREAIEIAAAQGLSDVERLPVGEGLFVATLPPERAYNIKEIKDILARLRSEARVRQAEPVPLAEIEEDCCGKSCGVLWDRCLVGIQHARALIEDPANAPLLALVDRLWQPPEELRIHPELCEADGSAGTRVVASLLLDCGPGPITASSPPLNKNGDGANQWSHALMCAGIAAGRISGVAPRSRVLLFKDPDDDLAHVRAWLWAGGLSSVSPAAGLPTLPGGGADIFCAPIGRPQGVTEAGIGALQRLVVAGRRGRGCLLFFSAGNFQLNILKDRFYGALPFTLAIAASTFDSSGKERFARNSGWGDVDLCAPSGAEKIVNNAGGRFDGVLAPGRPHRGDYPYRGMVETWTTAPFEIVGASLQNEKLPVASATGFVPLSHALLEAPDGRWASRKIYSVYDGQLALQPGPLGQFPATSRVVSASRRLGVLAAVVTPSSDCLELDSVPLEPLAPGQRVRVGAPGSPEVRSYTVRAMSESRITVDEELSAHEAGDQVYFDESHWNLSTGTSTAMPLCAGTAALMLEANPRLSWVEVRHLLRMTAVKIDLDCDDDLAAWLGRDGQPSKASNQQPYFSRRYGFGRLDAYEAVRQAILYDFPRDLMIRQFEADDGSVRSRPFGDSPDIWVRSQDPRSLAAEERDDPRWHEPVFRSRDSWIFARVRNRGRVESLEAWVRFYVAAGQEEPYRFPEDFEFRRAEKLDQGNWRRGTQFLGEVGIAGLGPGEAQVVAVWWNPELVPPRSDTEGQLWNPHLLVAISPLDGPEEGVTVLDCNNLAQRAIEIWDS